MSSRCAAKKHGEVAALRDSSEQHQSGHYLSALPLPRSAASAMAAGVLGLLVLWSVCGLTIWGVLGGVRVLERRRPLTDTHGLCEP